MAKLASVLQTVGVLLLIVFSLGADSVEVVVLLKYMLIPAVLVVSGLILERKCYK